MIFTIFIFLAVLSILVLAHEWGHYAAARKMGIGIEEFGIGFPPRLFGRKNKNGMLWSVNLIPLGGFVRIKGENGERRHEHDAFAQKSIPARIFVLLAGVMMNLLVAWVLFSAGFAFGLPAVVEDWTDKSAIVSNLSVDVVQIVQNSPASVVGLKEGDKILQIDGQAYTDGVLARSALAPHADGSPIAITYEREGVRAHVSVTPAYVDELGKAGVGVALLGTGNVRYPLYLAPVKGAETTISMTIQVVGAFVGLLSALFHHENVSANLSGPIGIATLTGQVARLGFFHLLQFTAMLSVNLAVLNALPFPALDGGRVFFVLVEGIRRKPNSLTFEQTAHTIGFALLILLVLFVTYKDIVKLF
ncbi:MAG: RIP metalloprotease RseP [Patescibacteria group bacterium]|jgi:regulator of sigma E protease